MTSDFKVEEIVMDKDMCIDELSFKIYGNYRAIPLIYDLNYDVKELIKKGQKIRIPLVSEHKKSEKENPFSI